MKRTLAGFCVCVLAGAAAAQESEETTVTTTTTTVAGGANLLDELWFVTDAVPVDAGALDLRFSFQWITSTGFASNRGDSDDDFIVQPSLVWGAADNLELSATTPVWVGDSGDAGPFEDGNGDTYLGFLWRFAEDAMGLYDLALAGTARIPTGCDSDKIDGELRLVMSHEYDNGVRSHFNAFALSSNGTNLGTFRGGDASRRGGLFGGGDDVLDEARDLQWGAVLGLDGPLCGDGSVRWVFDYLHRSSVYEGQNNWNMAELGWEWQMSDADKLGMSFQVSLDRSNDSPDFGTTLTYARALTY